MKMEAFPLITHSRGKAFPFRLMILLFTSCFCRLLRCCKLVCMRFLRNIMRFIFHQLLNLRRPVRIALFIDDQRNDQERKRYHQRKDSAHRRTVIDREETRNADNSDEYYDNRPQQPISLLTNPERTLKLGMRFSQLQNTDCHDDIHKAINDCRCIYKRQERAVCAGYQKIYE